MSEKRFPSEECCFRKKEFKDIQEVILHERFLRLCIPNTEDFSCVDTTSQDSQQTVTKTKGTLCLKQYGMLIQHTRMKMNLLYLTNKQ